MIEEKPILFSTEMVRAILDGRKTQTRRIYKKAPLDLDLYAIKKHAKEYIMTQCPYGKPGDVLWVREAFYKTQYTNTCKYFYKADLEPLRWDFKCSPSIHMPKEAARIWLKVSEITVERLNDISEHDAKSEGIESQFLFLFQEMRYRDYLYKSDNDVQHYWRDPRSSFRTLWESIHGENSWEHNPWVWVVKFEVLSTTGKPKEGQS